jgi:D-glycero-alpha-D-manno-heptose 1-phosphate guanylyltransferase
MTNEAIILAGGLGTRLKHVINDIPKPMAPINNKPFLEYLLNYLIIQGLNKFILSVCYKNDIIINHFGNNFKNCEIIYAIENEPLGTGGAIVNALNFVTGENVFIVNGDTFFAINFNELFNNFRDKNADIDIALRKMEKFSRYGSVKLDSKNKIIGFEEKKYKEHGYINGGVCVLKKKIFKNMPDKFLFEKDFLEKYYKKHEFYGLEFNDYFIDIGIPEDYEKVKSELPHLNLLTKLFK